jgi:TRAP-type uncharacterized transport system substrate-binding protein
MAIRKVSLKPYPYGLKTIMELFDIGPAIAITALATATITFTGAVIYFFESAPPTTITISSGPEGSVFFKNAHKYADILAKSGVKVKVLASNGSLENLQRLADPSSHVDVGIAQAGIPTLPTDEKNARSLVSLGSISYQPLLLFYRAPSLQLISELAGKKIAIGATGSGARSFALKLLAANGIEEKGSTSLLDWDADDAAKALTEGKIDAAFIMSESASSDILHNLLRSKAIHLYNYKQANAYNRKVDYLSVLELPEGSIDFGLDIPDHDVSLVGPMVELVATKNLHPALSDIILEAATEVHGKPGVFQRRGEFPNAIEHAIPISEDSVRFFKSGKSFFYRYLPFWIASLTSRIVVVFLPTLVILIPALRSIPAFFRWRTQAKIRRRYKELLSLEKEFRAEKDAEQQEILRQRFERIEDTVEKMQIRAAFADQFYGLRGHIDYVRGILSKKKADFAG